MKTLKFDSYINTDARNQQNIDQQASGRLIPEHGLESPALKYSEDAINGLLDKTIQQEDEIRIYKEIMKRTDAETASLLIRLVSIFIAMLFLVAYIFSH